jgi:HD associated region
MQSNPVGSRLHGRLRSEELRFIPAGLSGFPSDSAAFGGGKRFCSRLSPYFSALASKDDVTGITGVNRGLQRGAVHLFSDGPFHDFAGNLHEIPFFAWALRHAVMMTRSGGTARVRKIQTDPLPKFLAISIGGIHALEQFVLAKYYMTTQVYRHKIRLITDQMIERAIGLGIEVDNVGWLKALYSFDGSPEYIEHYLQWSDDRLVNEILGSATQEGYAKRFFARLHNRQLFKCIFDVDQNDFPDPDVRNFVFGDSKDFYKPLEKAIAEKFEFDANEVIAYTIKFDSAARTESEIPVIHQMKTTVFHDESALFKSVDQKIREQRFHIYAPIKYQDEKDKKKRLREFKNEILELIGGMANRQIRLALEGD